jgi:hypothetical protein
MLVGFSAKDIRINPLSAHILGINVIDEMWIGRERSDFYCAFLSKLQE